MRGEPETQKVECRLANDSTSVAKWGEVSITIEGSRFLFKKKEEKETQYEMRVIQFGFLTAKIKGIASLGGECFWMRKSGTEKFN